MSFARSVAQDFRTPMWTLVLPIRHRQIVTAEESLDQAMDRYAQGDEDAFAVLYSGLELRLRAFLIRVTGSPTVANDLVQETFLRIHRARGAFEANAAVVPWAYAIARNVWIDYIRASGARAKRHVNAEFSDSIVALEEGLTGPDVDSEQIAIARETAALVEGVLMRIPTTQREAFVLLRYEGMSASEAAEILGTTPTAVKLRAFRAYESLRQALRPESS